MIVIRIYMDTEFYETGRQIHLLSIGMVREDGERLYQVVLNNRAAGQAVQDDWLRENVVAHLPIKHAPERDEFGFVRWNWDRDHKDYGLTGHHYQVRDAVKQFIADTPDPQLWAWYGAYDHVAYAQLFGRMIELPDGFPMATFDVKQEAARLGFTDQQLHEHVKMEGAEHDALHDALWAQAAHNWLIGAERSHYRRAMAVHYFWDPS